MRRFGVSGFTLRIDWSGYYTASGVKNTGYKTNITTDIAALQAGSMDIVLDLAMQNTPAWLHTTYGDSSYLKNQFAHNFNPLRADGATPGIDLGDANIIFNPQVKAEVLQFMKDIGTDIGWSNFRYVRLGGGHFNELGFPPTAPTVASLGGLTASNASAADTNCYWSWDINARAQLAAAYPQFAVGGISASWVPGQNSPNNEASLFLTWHLNALRDFQNWQIAALRTAGYTGRIMMLYPGWGMRPPGGTDTNGDFNLAVATNLNNTSRGETSSEVQMAHDWVRCIRSMTDPLVITYCTWADAGYLGDPGGTYNVNLPPAARNVSATPYDWTPWHYIDVQGKALNPPLDTFGENTGGGMPTCISNCVAAARANNALGMGLISFTDFYANGITGGTPTANLTTLAATL